MHLCILNTILVLTEHFENSVPGEVLGLPDTHVPVHNCPGVVPPLVERLALANPGDDFVPAPNHKVESGGQNSWPVENSVL